MDSRILIILTTKLSLNGISKSVMNYYKHLNKKVFHIDFVVQNDADSLMKEEIERNNGKVYVLENRNKILKYSKNLFEILRRGKYDIVHVHGSSRIISLELFISKKAGVSNLIPHSHSSSNKYKLLHKLLRIPFEKLYTYPIACGNAAGKWFYNNKDFKVLNNGINLKEYEYNVELRKINREKYNIQESDILIGHVGHFIYPKNHEFLIDVFNELLNINPNYKLMLIGDGAYYDSIYLKVNQLGIENRVLFLGRVQNVPDLMQAFDAIVHPSIFEGVPLTLIEAQAANLPCFVSTNVSEEVKVTELIKFFDLDQGARKWANKINEYLRLNIDRTFNIDINKQNIIFAGYDSMSNADELMSIYKKMTKKEL